MRYITMRRRDTEQIVRTSSINSNEVIRGLTWIRLFVCGVVPYRQLELLAFGGLVPWVIICVCAGVA